MHVGLAQSQVGAGTVVVASHFLLYLTHSVDQCCEGCCSVASRQVVREVRRWTQWESVVREGRGLCVLCVGLKAAHLLNDYPYVLVQHIALSEYSFPFAH